MRLSVPLLIALAAGPACAHRRPEVDVQQISRRGELVDLREHVVPGKVTVFDFHASWCPPCRTVDSHLSRVLRRHDDVAVRKLNVSHWDSEVARAYLRNVPGLPFVVVFGVSGDAVAAISGLDLAALDAAIELGRQS